MFSSHCLILKNLSWSIMGVKARRLMRRDQDWFGSVSKSDLKTLKLQTFSVFCVDEEEGEKYKR